MADDTFRQVFEAAPNAMIVVAAGGRIALANAQAETIFGYQRDELIGMPIETLIPERFRAQHAAYRDGFARDPQLRAMGAGRELFGRRKDASEVALEIGLNAISTVDGPFVVASVIDVTERRRAKAEAQDLRHELAHLSRVVTVGELMAAIVHELAQPLAAIRTNARVAVRAIAGGDHNADELNAVLEDIVADSRRADQVIHHLRSLLTKGEVERQPLLLNSVIDNVVSVMLSEARRRRVSIDLDLAPRLPAVSGDRVQLQQVLLNLILNAFEAMVEVTERRRVVTLRTRTVDDTRVQVDVADNGPGIADDRLGSIFKPFVTTKPSGMGMGLAVSHSIVQAHEGQLWAGNAAGGGAVFHVVLPAIRDTPAP